MNIEPWKRRDCKDKGASVSSLRGKTPFLIYGPLKKFLRASALRFVPPPLSGTRRTRVFNRYKISPDLSSSRSNVSKNVPLNWTIFLFFRRRRYLDEKFGKFSVMKINYVIRAVGRFLERKKKSHMEYDVSIRRRY